MRRAFPGSALCTLLAVLATMPKVVARAYFRRSVAVVAFGFAEALRLPQQCIAVEGIALCLQEALASRHTPVSNRFALKKKRISRNNKRISFVLEKSLGETREEARLSLLDSSLRAAFGERENLCLPNSPLTKYTTNKQH
jgi:hypothetical protein